MADLHDDDLIAQANAAIERFIRSQPGGHITAEHKPEYEWLVRNYFTAIAARTGAREAEPEPEPVAA